MSFRADFRAKSHLIATLTISSFSVCQVLLSVLAHENKGGHVVRRLQEEIQRVAKTDGAHDVTPITMALLAGFQHARAAQVTLG